MRFWNVISLTLILGSGVCGADDPISPETARTASELLHKSYKGWGSLKVRVDSPGEPVNNPIRISISASCGKSMNFVSVLEDFRHCELKEVRVNSKENEILLDLMRYSPDTGKCDVPETKKITLQKAVCKK